MTKMNHKYRLFDTFNDREISQHRTAFAAGKAASQRLRAIRRREGQNSYLPIVLQERFRELDGDWDYAPCADEVAQQDYDRGLNDGY